MAAEELIDHLLSSRPIDSLIPRLFDFICIRVDMLAHHVYLHVFTHVYTCGFDVLQLFLICGGVSLWLGRHVLQ